MVTAKGIKCALFSNMALSTLMTFLNSFAIFELMFTYLFASAFLLTFSIFRCYLDITFKGTQKMFYNS